MSAATHEDVLRLFPGIQDHVVLDVLATGATVDELEAALLLLQGSDEALLEFKRDRGDRLNRLLDILDYSQVQAPDEPD